jgi:hypothetical protein
MILNPPNTFIQFWTAKELRNWLDEVTQRRKGLNWEGWEKITVPTEKQTRDEFRRRKLSMTVEKVPIAKEIIEMAFEMLDPDDIIEILREVKEIDFETYDLLTNIAHDLGKIPP